ncbi:outer membrane beta-barrel protein [Winogradskyella ouciana]|uniref:outer membrane beta-barrel protein n=1 Tax=Winogradskyella ouciana TaxID=2608631 RepID=UPI003D2BBC4F
MKAKVTLVLIFSILFLSPALAQKKLKLGLNVGGQYTDLRGFERQVKSDFEIGLMYGINIEYLYSDKISIVTGFNSERWTKKKEIIYFDSQANEDGKDTFKESHDFFNIPLLFRYKFGKKMQFFVDGGGFLNYFNKAKANEFEPLFINFEDFNYGLAFGIGTTFRFKNNTDITLQFRNDIGLADVNKNKDIKGGNIKTNTFRLIATYNFWL